MKHTLTVTRGSDTAAIYRSETPIDGIVDITGSLAGLSRVNGVRRSSAET